MTSGSPFIAVNSSRSSGRKSRSSIRGVSSRTILAAAELIEEATQDHRGLRQEIEPDVLVGRVDPGVRMAVADGDHRQLVWVADLVLRRRAGAREGAQWLHAIHRARCALRCVDDRRVDGSPVRMLAAPVLDLDVVEAATVEMRAELPFD